MSAEAIRRAYEMGRLRTSLLRAAMVTAPIAIAAAFVVGPRALVWAPVTLAAWVLAYWRGGAIQKGALFGVIGGLATILLPLSILRPCCAGTMQMTGASAMENCCTRPECCLLSGAVVGVLLAMVVPVAKSSSFKTAGGLVLGVASVAMLRCSTLYLGEAIGLVGGLIAGVAAASLGRRAYSKLTSTSAS
jgi:hypothetical protein